MNRRKILLYLGSAAVVPPLAAKAQPLPLPRVGFLNSASPDNYAFNAAAFRDGLREAGYVDGKNVTIEYRWAKGNYDQLPALAAELVSRNVAVIAATGDIASARAAQAATRKIPIVFTVGADPTRFGLVDTLSHPGGNATGITLFSSTLSAKRLELLRQIAPGASLIALFMNPDNPNIDADVTAAQEAARALGRQTIVVNARGPDEFDAAFKAAVAQRAGAILLASDPMFLGQRTKHIALAVQYKVPVMYWTREFAVAGGLMSYGSSITWMYREAGIYVGRILKGARPADLPVLQPAKFELIINLNTAKALGIAVPQSLLLRADEVIQ
ncbi:MAG: ABC transporter substrate-binding protein [Betaproteobacteria bacterium]|nr:MAG: ABC transporter substrate-binding protein [Betaproteobacteria bacterium]